MLAFSLVLAIVLFWSIVGFALVSTLYTRRNLLQNALLSPVTGVAATGLLVVALNCAGLPVRYGGPAATVLLAALSAWRLRRVRSHIFPGRRLAPFVGVLLIAAIVTGYPMLRFGFSWVSYCNDDMANYSLGGKLFLDRGHFGVPPDQDIIANRDASSAYWYFYVVKATRHGVEELLAWLSSCTGLSPHQAFMPLILSFHLVLIASAGAMVLRSRKYRKAALLTCLALALSALTTLGTEYQLLGQVCGLGMLTACCAVFFRPLNACKRSEVFFRGILAGGMGLMYPEVIPFFVISFCLYHAVLITRGIESLKHALSSLGISALFAGALLNVMLLVTGLGLLGQAQIGLSPSLTTQFLFPDYMTPVGLATLWGFHAIGQTAVSGSLDLGIVIGGILLVLSLCAAVRQAWRGQPAAFPFLVMLAMALNLFRMRVDFGVYKIAMYIQPFLISTIVISFLQLRESARNRTALRRVYGLAFCALVLSGMRSQAYYSWVSTGTVGGGFVEIPSPSSSDLVGQLKRLQGSQHSTWLSDSTNVVLAKFEALYLGPILFSADPFGRFLDMTEFERSRIGKINPFYQLYKTRARGVELERDSQYPKHYFDMRGALPTADDFNIQRGISGNIESHIIESSRSTDIVNRRVKDESVHRDGQVRVVNGPQNYLMFVTSEFGYPYYTGMPNRLAGRVSMYQPEPDYFFRNETMASIGRVTLFCVVNPSSAVRMVVSYTASLNADRQNSIPPASVIGDERRMLTVTGRGSARLFSAPIHPQQIDGGSFVALDMGTWGWSFPDHRSWLMRLYGKDVLPDSRKIVGFGRDISLISEEEYSSLQAPRSIQLFPSDLSKRDLEYSGIYEDGWIGESSYAVLSQPEGSPDLVVSLAVPMLHGRPASSWAAVLLDGKEVGRQSIHSGLVFFNIPVQGWGKRRVELRLDRADNLPEPDNRPVSARVRFIGFRASNSQVSRARP
jgi:hypothetical protein